MGKCKIPDFGVVINGVCTWTYHPVVSLRLLHFTVALISNWCSLCRRVGLSCVYIRPDGNKPLSCGPYLGAAAISWKEVHVNVRNAFQKKCWPTHFQWEFGNLKSVLQSKGFVMWQSRNLSYMLPVKVLLDCDDEFVVFGPALLWSDHIFSVGM